MDVELIDGARAFLDASLAYRANEPLLTNVLGSVAGAVATGRRRYDAHWWWVVRQGGAVVGAAMRTAPHGLVLGPMDDDGADALGRAVAELYREVPWVDGPVAANEAFRAAYLRPASPVGPRRSRRGRRSLVYEVTTLVAPEVPGVARRATRAELDLVTRWVVAFHRETGLAIADSPGETRVQFARRVDEDDLLLWEVDGQAVALAGVVGVTDAPAAPLSRLGPVYTVPRARRRGYGAAVTAALAARELDRGRRVMLYADADYAPSNAAYLKIGFVARAETQAVWLDPR
ncbi:MAG: hypothetical protein B7Z69_01810 [Actinobacteria bacterium 21-73-9]|nr:MAG: hypothetical protein B7Z69_01810 [Actinobacteria bacterium 21-73-9]